MAKCGDMSIDEMLATLNVIGSTERCRQLRAGELLISKPVRRWQEQDGVITFTLTSDGTTGPEWIRRLESKGDRVGDYAKYLLNSPDFQPTSGVTHKVKVLKGALFSDGNRISKKIRAEATKRQFAKPNAELACLIRDNFSDKEIEVMGLWWIIIMHEPITDADGEPGLLGADRDGRGRWLGAYCDEPDSRWLREGGFAFVSSQSPSN